MYKLLNIVDPGLDDIRWQEYHNLLEQLHIRYKSQFSKTSWSIFKEQTTSYSMLNRHVHHFLLLYDKTAIGWIRFNVMNYGVETQQILVLFDALFNEIPIDVSKVMAVQIHKLLKQYSHNPAHIIASDQRISNIARSWKCKELNRLERYQLHRAKANLNVINSWLEMIPAKNKELSLKFQNFISEKYIAQYAELFTRFLNDMPKERESSKKFHFSEEEMRRHYKWFKAHNRPQYNYLLLNPDNKIIGFSQASINEHDPSDVYQGMTGIEREYRGLGLSKWLKAALFKKIGEDFPENKILTTDMRAVNVPIQRVNHEMGFELIRQGNEFEITHHDIDRYLKKI